METLTSTPSLGIFPHWQAIVAMADGSRIIGREGRLPWSLPEDLAWFRRATRGHTLVMGRTTWLGVGRALPHRRCLCLSRQSSQPPVPGVSVVASLAALAALPIGPEETVWIAGGTQVYAAALPHCSTLWLSRIWQAAEGDVTLPPFEDAFALAEVTERYATFQIEKWRRRSVG